MVQREIGTERRRNTLNTAEGGMIARWKGEVKFTIKQEASDMTERKTKNKTFGGMTRCTTSFYSDLSQASTFLQKGPDRIGRVYKKAMFRQYRDSTYRQQIPGPTWLGFLGPILRAEVGEVIIVHLKNFASRNYSIHPHGVFYKKEAEGKELHTQTYQHAQAETGCRVGGSPTGEKPVPDQCWECVTVTETETKPLNLVSYAFFLSLCLPFLFFYPHISIKLEHHVSEAVLDEPTGRLSTGALYPDGTSKEKKMDDAVPPGGNYTYRWEVRPEFAPTDDDASCLTWVYHSHVDAPRDIASGLVGSLLTCKKGMKHFILSCVAVVNLTQKRGHEAARRGPHARSFFVDAGVLKGSAQGWGETESARHDVDQDVVLMFSVVDENLSWYQEENIKSCQKPDLVDLEDPDFHESNLMHGKTNKQTNKIPQYF